MSITKKRRPVTNGKTKKYIQTAKKLFLEKGYENTSVQNIIDALGVAKGTFYYYFPSKEALIDEMITDFVGLFAREVSILAERKDLTGLEKLNLYFTINQELKKSEPELMMIFLKAMHNDNNILFRHKLLKKGFENILPQFIKILKQGKTEGDFDVEDPVEATEILMSLGSTYLDSIGILMLQLEEKPELLELIKRKLLAYESAFARVLGIEKTRLKMIDFSFFDSFKGVTGDKNS